MEKIQSTETLASHESGAQYLAAGYGQKSRAMLLKNASGMVGRAPSRSDRPSSTTSQNWKRQYTFKSQAQKRSDRMIETWDDFLAFSTHGRQHRASVVPTT
ncbi:uncharacterized protein LOC117122287, partial [Anneissia japonica]|uniref:uncharacterized protein LOC117122287 n=1 Tax=Anneissia japonica TaxID=1529436 RepID=UPI00142554D0